MKDITTELRYLKSDTEALEIALSKNDVVFARRLIEAIRETTDNLAAHTEEIAGQGRFTVIEVN